MTNGSVKAREGAFTHNLKIIKALRWCEGVKALFDFRKGKCFRSRLFDALGIASGEKYTNYWCPFGQNCKSASTGKAKSYKILGNYI